MKIKRGDNVFVVSGGSSGKQGRVIRVLPQENRVVVEGVAVRKKHVKPKQSGQKGQVVEVPSAFSLSNVKLVCPKCQKRVRAGYRQDGKEKIRICKNCSNPI